MKLTERVDKILDSWVLRRLCGEEVGDGWYDRDALRGDLRQEILGHLLEVYADGREQGCLDCGDPFDPTSRVP
jgi:hypothetical protein